MILLSPCAASLVYPLCPSQKLLPTSMHFLDASSPGYLPCCSLCTTSPNPSYMSAHHLHSGPPSGWSLVSGFLYQPGFHLLDKTVFVKGLPPLPVSIIPPLHCVQDSVLCSTVLPICGSVADLSGSLSLQTSLPRLGALCPPHTFTWVASLILQFLAKVLFFFPNNSVWVNLSHKDLLTLALFLLSLASITHFTHLSSLSSVSSNLFTLYFKVPSNNRYFKIHVN